MIRLALWATAFLLLVMIFYLIYEIVTAGIDRKFEDVDIFVKLPIFLTPLGILWALLLILFTQMTTALKDDSK